MQRALNTGRAAPPHDFLNQELAGQSAVLFASCGIPLSQQNLSGRKRDREFESGFLQRRVMQNSGKPMMRITYAVARETRVVGSAPIAAGAVGIRFQPHGLNISCCPSVRARSVFPTRSQSRNFRKHSQCRRSREAVIRGLKHLAVTGSVMVCVVFRLTVGISIFYGRAS